MDVQLPYDHGELDLDKTTTYWLNYFKKKKYMRPGDSNRVAFPAPTTTPVVKSFVMSICDNNAKHSHPLTT